jgi:hypothetical protein
MFECACKSSGDQSAECIFCYPHVKLNDNDLNASSEPALITDGLIMAHVYVTYLEDLDKVEILHSIHQGIMVVQTLNPLYFQCLPFLSRPSSSNL